MNSTSNTPKYLKDIPNLPGVYLFKDGQDAILYIGKAKALRTRVRSYFRKQLIDWKIESLIAEHARVDYIQTKNELEALLLEAQLIRDYKPKYNVLLKTGQPFLYILFTPLPEPTIKLVRNKKEKGSYFGPFLQKKEARAAYDYLVRTFKLRVCNMRIDGGCLDYHLGLCAGRCMGSFDAGEYIVRLELAKQALQGNFGQAVEVLEERIAAYTCKQEFEKARNLHGYLQNLETIFETLKTKFTEKKYDTDIFVATTPSLLVKAVLEKNIQEKSKKRKEYSNPSYTFGLQELKELLNMPACPKIIDCFDISHFQGRYIVGSCIRFKDGMPDKSGFRRFKIKTLTQQNDYAALQEIVSRRYKDTRLPLPDIVLIDGGKGQLNAVKSIMPNLLFTSLAKREERFFTPFKPEGIKLDISTPLGQLLIALRDYAHHFAISYHKVLRKKETYNHANQT